jgi:hypothetical protein
MAIWCVFPTPRTENLCIHEFGSDGYRHSGAKLTEQRS